MIKLIIFDLDGVIADTEHIHFSALCDAIHMVTKLSYEKIYEVIKIDGSTTQKKLLNLQTRYELHNGAIKDIDNLKQQITLEKLCNIKENSDQIEFLSKLSDIGIKMAIGSNSRKNNVDAVIDSLNIRKFFNIILTNNDIEFPKPNPEIFNRIIKFFNVSNYETLILEDSESGQAAAIASGSHLLKINSCSETTFENIINAINEANNCRTNGRIRNSIF